MAISGTIRNKAYMAARRCCCLIGRICGQNIVKHVWGIYLQKSTQQHTTTAPFAPMWRGLCNPAPFLNCPSLYICSPIVFNGAHHGVDFFYDTRLLWGNQATTQTLHAFNEIKLQVVAWMRAPLLFYDGLQLSFFFSESNRFLDVSLPGLVYAWPFEGLRPPDKGA